MEFFVVVVVYFFVVFAELSALTLMAPVSCLVPRNQLKYGTGDSLKQVYLILSAIFSVTVH